MRPVLQKKTLLNGGIMEHSEKMQIQQLNADRECFTFYWPLAAHLLALTLSVLLSKQTARPVFQWLGYAGTSLSLF